MKMQFDAKSGNKQVADDDTTVQVQIGRGWLVSGVVVVLVLVALLVFLN